MAQQNTQEQKLYREIHDLKEIIKDLNKTIEATNDIKVTLHALVSDSLLHISDDDMRDEIEANLKKIEKLTRVI